MFCVYKTTYLGNKMPSQYIGSSNEEKIEKGYKGSVRSKKWKDIWESELKEHPELFVTEILSLHESREAALIEELRLQKLFDVVKSDDWINMSYANVNGYFGMDVSGQNNPMYGKGEKQKEWCKNNPEKASERARKAAITQWSDPIAAAEKIAAMQGHKKTRKTQTEEEYLAMQAAKFAKGREKMMPKIEYNGIIYIGWKEFEEKTGLTKHLYKKYYLNGIDPFQRKGKNGPLPKNHKPISLRKEGHLE